MVEFWIIFCKVRMISGNWFIRLGTMAKRTAMIGTNNVNTTKTEARVRGNFFASTLTTGKKAEASISDTPISKSVSNSFHVR